MKHIFTTTDDAEIIFGGIAGADGVRDMVRKLRSGDAAF